MTDELLDAMLKKESGGATPEMFATSLKKEGAVGLYQQRDIFYKDVTEIMGFPEYDRNDPVQARKAVKHYLEYVMKNQDLTLEQAVATYNAGRGSSTIAEGGGKAYAATVFDIMGPM